MNHKSLDLNAVVPFDPSAFEREAMTDTGVLRSIAEAGGDPTTEQVLAACDDLDALKADNARLRALVKAREFPAMLDRCVSCGARPGELHFECRAFNPDGTVK